jgi:septal ring factor EnvC (AmiA/AmiB activator)
MPATKATQDVLTDLFHTNQNKQREMSEEIGRLKNENNNLREQIINLKRTNKKSNNKKRAHK